MLSESIPRFYKSISNISLSLMSVCIKKHTALNLSENRKIYTSFVFHIQSGLAFWIEANSVNKLRHYCIGVKVKVKVKFTLEQATKAQRGVEV
jgi:hypothetical protein